MTQKAFVDAWLAARKKAAALGVRLRPVAPENALDAARRALVGNRESDGFSQLAALGHWELTLEALAVDKRFTALFSDDAANNALLRLLESGYRFF